MTKQPVLSYAQYLTAKKTVDDRALNMHVVDCLRDELAQSPSVRVLDIGAGVGTMASRLVDWGVLKHAQYTLLDVDADCLATAPAWLSDWAASTARAAQPVGDALRVVGGAPAIDLTVRSVYAELGDFLDSTKHRHAEPFDLLIANAFLDLVDVPTLLPSLFGLLKSQALFWFSINFDGETIFMPEHPGDQPLLNVYHRSMDERIRLGRPAGDSRSGRHLFAHLPAAGASILAAGSSDWVVHARDGNYPAKERDFVEHILHTIDAELNWRTDVDQELLTTWLAERREQLRQGDLVYIAHQLDFVGRRP